MRFSSNEKLTEFERELIKADALRAADEIERAANAPHLLTSIRARIEAEQAARLMQPENNFVPAPTNANSVWRRFALPKVWRQSALVAAAAIVCAILAWQFIGGKAPQDFARAGKNLKSQTTERAEPETISPPESNTAEQMRETIQTKTGAANDKQINEKPSAKIGEQAIAQTAPQDFSLKPKHARRAANANKSPISKNARAISQPNRIKNNRQPRSIQPREFYQLAFAGELEPNEAKQIVRVKLSPVALQTLGAPAAPLSARNQNSVTADLLLGEDGSPRAIRFVK